MYRFLLFLFSMCMLEAKAQQLQFTPLKFEDILDRQVVLSIAQSSDGRLWFGGQSNLFVYDSKKVVNLRTSDSLFNNLGYITKISINSQNDLFVGTDNGVHIFGLENSSGYALDSLRTVGLVHDLQYINGLTFICSQQGLYIAKKQGEKYEFQALKTGHPFYTIESLNETDYAISSSQGVQVIRLDAQNTLSYKETLDLGHQLNSNDRISTMYFINDRLWLGSQYSGLFRYNLRDQTCNRLHTGNSDLPSNNIRAIIEDSKGNIQLGTLKGLSIVREKDSFINYKHDPSIPGSLLQNSIYDLFVDQQNITWIGTYWGGIHAVYPNDIEFTVYNSSLPAVGSLSSNVVSSIAESDQGLWIGTEEEGINFKGDRVNRAIAFPSFTTSSLIKDLFVADEHLYTAQYFGGYSVIDLKSHKVKHVKIGKEELDLRNNIYSIHVDKQKSIYLGTNAGLYIKNAVSDDHVLVQEIPPYQISDIVEDQVGTIFALQGSQLYYKKPLLSDFEHIALPGGFTVKGMFVENGKLWLTTNKGIGHLGDPDVLDFTHLIDAENNLFGNLLKDGNILWVASRKGLVYMDLESGYTTVLNKEDGLPLSNLEQSKLFLSKDRILYMATINGLVSFDPATIKFNLASPQVFLSSIAVHDKILDRNRLTRATKSQIFTIDLAYNENFVTIDFASNNLIKPLKNKYKYKLEGYDEQWVETSFPTIRYTNLPAGEHTLLIMTSNHDQVWSEHPLVLNLHVHPPFWKTWWAYTFYVLSLAVLAYIVFRFLVVRQLLQQSKIEHEKKIRFFTQISHEIRTPLTLITTPLDEIITESIEEPSVHRKLQRLKKNADKLLSIVNELLDFKKIDNQKQTLYKVNTDFYHYIEDIFYLFTDSANHKHINYYIKRMDDVGLLAIDTSQFDKVLFNLLSNAIKYTPANGTVYLELINQKDTIQIRVVDNGGGVSEKNQFRIFEEYYREGNKKDILGMGIGLALTKSIVEQHGGDISCQTINDDGKPLTVFTITLPKIFLHQNPSVLDADEPIEVAQKQEPVPKTLHSSETILIIEDNEELMAILIDLFQDDFQILSAHNGEEGLRLAQNHIPDLILSDVMMPGMNGFEVCQAVKSKLNTSHIPVVLLTSLNQESMQLKGLENGANLYIHKPFNRKELFLSIRNLLRLNQGAPHKETIKSHQEQVNKLDQSFLEKLNTLIVVNMNNPELTVDFISKQMGVSAPVLYKKLKYLCNESVNNYVKAVRLNRAKELLLTTMSIQEIAYQVGFNDPKYFSKEFKKQFQQSPTDVRKRRVISKVF